jgi:hypothetical protein
MGQDGFLVTSRGGAKFSDVDLSEDWSEWDERASESVGVSELAAKWELHKGK